MPNGAPQNDAELKDYPNAYFVSSGDALCDSVTSYYAPADFETYAIAEQNT